MLLNDPYRSEFREWRTRPSDIVWLRTDVAHRIFSPRSQHGTAATDASPQDAVERQHAGRSTAGMQVVRPLATTKVRACWDT